MRGIVLFDIDKTIFDRDRFLGDFYKLFDSKLVVESLYEENKKQFGNFSYKEFLRTLVTKYPKLEKEIKAFFEIEAIEKYIFEDSSMLFQIKNFQLGIWSKGDSEFQKQKITVFNKILNKDLIFIFQNKIEKLPSILEEKNIMHKLFFVDDSLEALEAAKDEDESVVTILVDREKKYSRENMKIDFRLESLSDIIQVLN